MKRMSLKERVQAAILDDNGPIRVKRRNDDMISGLVECGVVPSGWILAYGSFNSYRENSIYELYKKKSLRRNEVAAMIELLEEENCKVAVKIAEVQRAARVAEELYLEIK